MLKAIFVDPRHVKALLMLIQRAPMSEAETTFVEDTFDNWANQMKTITPADPPLNTAGAHTHTYAGGHCIECGNAAPAPADPASAEHAYADAVDRAAFLAP